MERNVTGTSPHNEERRRPVLRLRRPCSLLDGVEHLFSSAELTEAQRFAAALYEARNAWDLKRKTGGRHHG